MQKLTLKQTGVILAVCIIAGKVFSFFKQIAIARLFGYTEQTDLYFVAESVIALFCTMYSTAVATSVLSTHAHVATVSSEKAGIFERNVISFSLIISSVIIFLIEITAPTIARLFPLSEDGCAILTSYLRLLAIVVMPLSLSTIWGSILESNNVYLPSKVSSIIVAPVSILVLYFTRFHEGFSLVFSFLAGYTSYFVFIIYSLSRKKLFGFNFKCFNSEMFDLIKLSLPTMLSVMLIDLNHMVDKYLATGLSNSGVSILYYAQILTTDLFSSIFVLSISSLLINKFAESVANNVDVSMYIRRTFKIIMPLSFIVVIVFIFFSKGISIFVFGSKGLNESGIKELTGVVAVYSLSILFIPFREILFRLFYANKNTNIPFLISIIGMLINIFLSVQLSKWLGLIGIAIATSCSFLFSSVLTMVISAKKYNLRASNMIPVREFNSLILASFLSSATSYALISLLPYKENILLLLSEISISVVVYIVTIYSLCPNILKEYIDIVRKNE